MSKNLSSPPFDATTSGVKTGVEVVNGNGLVRALMSTSSVSIVVTSPETVPGADVELIRSQTVPKKARGKARSVGSSEHERQKTDRR